MAGKPFKWPSTFVGFIALMLAVCAIITLFKPQFSALADWLIHPSVPHPGEIDVPGVK